MKKLFTILVMALSVFTLNAQNAKVVLTAGDVWGDGTGYQLMLNSTNSVDLSNFKSNYCGHSAEMYLPDWDYTIPTDAANGGIVINSSDSLTIPAGTYTYAILNPSCIDPDTVEARAWQNWLEYQDYYQDTLGYPTYDSIHDALYDFIEDQMYSIIWIAGSGCDSSKATMEFEAGKTYTFAMSLSGTADCVTLTVTETPNEVGIEYFYGMGIHIWPNPATDFINVETSNAEKIEIINFLGQTIISTNVESVSIDGLESGIYFVRVSNSNSTVTKKFVKE